MSGRLSLDLYWRDWINDQFRKKGAGGPAACEEVV